MSVSIMAVAAATIVQFVAGAVWYMPVFGKMWGEMFGFDKLSKEEQKKQQAGMMPWMVLQLIMTVFNSYALAWFAANNMATSIYKLTFIAWLGFFVPTQVSAVIFGGTEARWIKRRILIMAGGSLFTLMAGALVIHAIQK